jgi:hypothetical protein
MTSIKRHPLTPIFLALAAMFALFAGALMLMTGGDSIKLEPIPQSHFRLNDWDMQQYNLPTRAGALSYSMTREWQFTYTAKLTKTGHATIMVARTGTNGEPVWGRDLMPDEAGVALGAEQLPMLDHGQCYTLSAAISDSPSSRSRFMQRTWCAK